MFTFGLHFCLLCCLCSRWWWFWYLFLFPWWSWLVFDEMNNWWWGLLYSSFHGCLLIVDCTTQVSSTILDWIVNCCVQFIVSSLLVVVMFEETNWLTSWVFCSFEFFPSTSLLIEMLLCVLWFKRKSWLTMNMHLGAKNHVE
jgi:hypothetical protein